MAHKIKIQTTVKDAVDIFLLDCASRRLTVRSIAFYQFSLQKFITWAISQSLETLDQVTPGIIRKYQIHLANRKLSAVYQHNLTRALKTLFNFAVAERMIAESAFRNIKLPILPKTILPALTPEEERQLLRAASLCKLNAGGVDLATGAVQVSKGKGQKSRVTATADELGQYSHGFVVSRVMVDG